MGFDTKFLKDQKYRFLRGVIITILVVLIMLVLGELGCADVPGFGDIIDEAVGAVKPDKLPEGVMYIHMLDVGQGDCILVQHDKYNVLIDAGENGMGDEVLAYLEKHNILSLDYVIGSHPHSDHIGGLDTVISGIKAENIILTRHRDENVPATKTYNDLLTAVMNSSLGITTASAGASYTMGEMTMTILSSGEQYTDYNDTSIVLHFDFGQTDFITCGDISAAVEKDIMSMDTDLSAAVMKASHHGSAQSNSAGFIDAVSPSLVLISCGENNDYGHPSDRVLDMLKAREINYLRTDLCGDIIIKCDGKNIFTEQE